MASRRSKYTHIVITREEQERRRVNLKRDHEAHLLALAKEREDLWYCLSALEEDLPCVVKITTSPYKVLYLQVEDVLCRYYGPPGGHYNQFSGAYYSSDFGEICSWGLPPLPLWLKDHEDCPFYHIIPCLVGVVLPGSFYREQQTLENLSQRLTDPDVHTRSAAKLDWITTQMCRNHLEPLCPGLREEIDISQVIIGQTLVLTDRKVQIFDLQASAVRLEKWKARWIKLLEARRVADKTLLQKWADQILVCPSNISTFK